MYLKPWAGNTCGSAHLKLLCFLALRHFCKGMRLNFSTGFCRILHIGLLKLSFADGLICQRLGITKKYLSWRMWMLFLSQFWLLNLKELTFDKIMSEFLFLDFGLVRYIKSCSMNKQRRGVCGKLRIFFFPSFSNTFHFYRLPFPLN